MAESERPSQLLSNRGCLIVALVAAALAAIVCVVALAVFLVLVPASGTNSGPGPGPGALPDLVGPRSGPVEAAGPDAHVSIIVLSDGCAVERGEVTGSDTVSQLTWVIADELGVPVLERNAQNEYRYRYWVEGAYSVSLKAWYEGAYWTISDRVEIRCP